MSDFKAIAASVDVSPSRPVILSGNGLSDQPISSVDDPIEWQAVRLNSGEEDIYIISGDFLSAGKEMRAIAEEALLDVPRQNILLTATHTHGAPAIDPMLPVLGRVDADYLSEAGEKLKVLLQKLSAETMEPAVMRHGRGGHHGNVYRRRRVWRPRPPFRVMAMMPDETVPVPEDIHLVRLEGTDGSPIAIIWSWACHPTCYPDKQTISADFPGAVRDRLRSVYPDLPILFLQGFAGDIRPSLYEEGTSWKARFKRLLYGKAFGAVNVANWKTWKLGLENAVLGIDRAVQQETALNSATGKPTRSQIPLSEFQDVSVNDRDMAIQFMPLADGLTIAALGCEPVHGLCKYFTRNTVDAVITVGYVDHIFGYLPTDQQITEHGYEDSGFRRNFSLPGKYYHNAEQRFARIISDLSA